MNHGVILHSDLNAFYASVEMMLNPALHGKAVAVCGATEDRHGIVLAKSELAKKAGVKTGMVNWEARQKCPDLILVPPQYDQYLKYSRLARAVYGRFSDLVEPYGMDECWVGLDPQISFADGIIIADTIREAMKEELGLSVSIGVSFNKIFAKLGSDMKKPDAITVITPENFREKIWPLPASDLLFVGRATTQKLHDRGILTIGDIAAANPDDLKRFLGINGIKLWKYASGLDDTPVMHKNYVSPIKSVGHGITCITDLYSEEEVWKVILAMSQDIGHKLRLYQLQANGVHLSIRSKDLRYYQMQGQLNASTQNAMMIAVKARHLFQKHYQWNTPVRAVTVRAINLQPDDKPEQLNLFSNPDQTERTKKLDICIDELHRRFGNKSIQPAALLGDLKIPEREHDIIMPGTMGR